MCKFFARFFIWASRLWRPPSPEEMHTKQLLESRRQYLDACLDLEWAEARVDCHHKTIERLTTTVVVDKVQQIRDDWLTRATFNG